MARHGEDKDHTQWAPQAPLPPGMDRRPKPFDGRVVEPHRARFADGTEREFCCAPAMTAAGEVVAFWSTGDPTPGVCHHPTRPNPVEDIDRAEVQAWLASVAWRSGRSRR